MTLLGFFETSLFTRKIVDLISDEQYTRLQILLCEHPDFGKLIKAGGGIRKMRWSAQGKGKSGGIRVLYYWIVDCDRILFLDVYAKNDKEDIGSAELKILRRIVEELS